MKVLAIHPFGIGDVIFSFWALESLKRSTDCEIGFLCNERTESLVRLNPAVKEVFVFNRDALRLARKKSGVSFLAKLYELTQTLRRHRYDLAIDFSLGREFAFLAMCAGIKRRVGFDYRRRGLFLTQKIVLDGFETQPVREHYLDLVSQAVPDVEASHSRYPDLTLGSSTEFFWHQWKKTNGINDEER